MSQKIQDVMSRNVATCKESDSVQRAARIMREDNIGFVPVTDERGRLTGVITDRDLAVRVLAENRRPETPVSAIMSTEDLLRCEPGDLLDAAEDKMKQSGTARVLVCEGDKIVGVVSRTEIVNGDPEHAGDVLKALVEKGRKNAPSNPREDRVERAQARKDTSAEAEKMAAEGGAQKPGAHLVGEPKEDFEAPSKPDRGLENA